jgi:hypothetical protein
MSTPNDIASQASPATSPIKSAADGNQALERLVRLLAREAARECMAARVPDANPTPEEE